MEWKIGEIKQINGEWYQCLKSASCDECAFLNSNCIDSPRLKCSVDDRSDNCSVIFKKLEKVGEPFPCRNMSSGRYSIIAQWYKVFVNPILTDDSALSWYNSIDETILIALNNKEDMKEVNNPNLSNTENIGKNFKPFDLQAAKAGKPVCTRGGRKARIICFDKDDKDNMPIVALVYKENESVCIYYEDGRQSHFNETKNDLMMLPEKKEGWVNVYHGFNGISEHVCGDIVSNTKEDAIQYAQNRDSYITTVKIEWEE